MKSSPQRTLAVTIAATVLLKEFEFAPACMLWRILSFADAPDRRPLGHKSPDKHLL